MGQPEFCWVDVERELKSWVAMEADAIEAVIAENERKYIEASEAESQRRAALANQTYQKFKWSPRAATPTPSGTGSMSWSPTTEPPSRCSDPTCIRGTWAGREGAAGDGRTQLVGDPMRVSRTDRELSCGGLRRIAMDFMPPAVSSRKSATCGCRFIIRDAIGHYLDW